MVQDLNYVREVVLVELQPRQHHGVPTMRHNPPRNCRLGHVRRGFVRRLIHLVDDKPPSHAAVDGRLIEVAHNVVWQGDWRPRGELLGVVVQHDVLVVGLTRP